MYTFIVRPTNSDKEAFRVRLTATSMLALKLKSGDLCDIRTSSQGSETACGSAIAWEALGAGIKDTIVQTSKFLQDLYGFKLGDKVTISRSSRPLQPAEVVSLRRVSTLSTQTGDDKAPFWEYYAKLTVPLAYECLARSQRLVFRLGSESPEFIVEDLGIPNTSIARVTDQTVFQIVQDSRGENLRSDIDFSPSALGGLQNQIHEMRQIVARLCRPTVKQHFRSYRPIQGVLIYGAKGTGKTSFIEALAASGWHSVIRWTPGAKLVPSNEPRLITIRTRYLCQPSGATLRTSDELDDLFDMVKGTPSLVVAEVKHPNDIDQALRSEGKFVAEVELPIPSALQRKEILEALRGQDAVPDDSLLQDMATRTHGYVGADLYALLRRTLELACERSAPTGVSAFHAEESKGMRASDTGQTNDNTALQPTSGDLEQALRQVRPSALQEIFLETPDVHWSDIGGQHAIKRRLQNAVERPLKFADRMRELGLQPKKGVLLYGPPGCSKTLLVKALATEAGLNFLAVKGAELISMYVGESERATREVFRKARAASPSIIFFDEIDAIAARGKSGNDLNVLTTLLNEMDGFEELRNVLVVAATNKPQYIDPALLRPGRFDNVVYIGPPDLEARTEIFLKRLAICRYEAQTNMEADAGEFASITQGCSGAEIVAICQNAGEYAFDADRSVIVPDDIRKAIQQTPRSITKDMLWEFETWGAARMR